MKLPTGGSLLQSLDLKSVSSRKIVNAIAYMSAEVAGAHLAGGALVRVVAGWCQPFPGFDPSRRQ